MFGNLKLLLFIEVLLIAGVLLFRFCLRRDAQRAIKPLYLYAVLITPAAGMLLGNFNLFYLFMLLLPFAAGRQRTALAGLYLAVLLQFPELPQAYIIGSLYLGTVSALTAFNLGTLVALFAVRGRERHNLASLDACAWGMFMLLLLSQARGYEVAVALRQTHMWFLLFMPPYLVLTRTIRSREEAREAMLVFTWSAVICAVEAIFESLRGWPLYQSIQVALHVPAVGQGLSATLSIRSGFLRAQGPVANPTSLGIVMAMALTFAQGLNRYLNRSYRWAIYGTLIVGLIVSQSRGAWIAAGVGYAVVLLMQRRYAVLGAIAPVGLVAWLATGALSAEGQLGQLLGKSGQGEFTAHYRSDLLHRGLEEIGKHPTGQTPEQLQISMDDMRQGEHIIDFVNSHLYIGLVTGIAGLALWFIFWFYPAIAAVSAKSSLNGRRTQMPIEYSVGAMAACFVALLFTSPIDRNPSLVAVTFAFIAVTVRLTRRPGSAARTRQRSRKDETAAKELVPA